MSGVISRLMYLPIGSLIKIYYNRIVFHILKSKYIFFPLYFHIVHLYFMNLDSIANLFSYRIKTNKIIKYIKNNYIFIFHMYRVYR